VDCDRTDIPAVYDRGRDHGPEFLDLWLTVIESRVDGGSISTILDLGCGTGRFSEGSANRGFAEAVPLVDGAVDMIFMSMSVHHFHDPDLAARECRRALRAG
jgi:ubiquinone/menaquinone biosynthesis C-methylase UbiE